MVTITGKDFKDIIPPDLVLEMRNVTFLDDDRLVMLDLQTSLGDMQVIVYRQAAAKLMRKSGPKTDSKSKSNGSAAFKDPQAALKEEFENVEERPKTAKKKGMFIGKTRRYEGRQQVLTGFSNTGSIREKPVGVLKKVRNPGTDTLVWPLWESDDA